MFIRNVLQQALQEVVLGAVESAVLFGAVIQVAETDFAVPVFFRQPVHGDHGTLQITPQVMGVTLSVGAGFGEVNDPVFLIMAVQPAVLGHS